MIKKKDLIDFEKKIVVEYNEGRIPYPVVMKMRDKFSMWAVGYANPFNQPIEDFVELTANLLA